MKKIVCELCEGTEFIKDSGMFVCQGCGTKYTAEEARGMMREGEDGASHAGITVVPQVNPNQQQLDNILILASTADEADNHQETEKHCNRAIELDATCYNAWFLKAKAVGWSSTMDNPRVEEAAHSFCQAIDFAPEEEKKSLKEEAVDQLKRIGLAMIATRKNRFASSPNKEEYEGFRRDIKVLLDALMVLWQHGNIVSMPEGYLDKVATLMNEAGVGAVKMARQAWADVEHPSKKAWDTYIDWYYNIAQLFRDSIKLSDEEDVIRYKNLIVALEDPIGEYSWTREWSSYRREYVWQKEYCLADSSVDARKKEVQQCRDKIAEIKKADEEKKADEAKKVEEEKQARIKAYWEEHVDEKKALNAEKKELEDKKVKLNAEIAEQDKLIDAAEAEKKAILPSEYERYTIEKQIEDLENRRSKLGLFAGKEKKQISEEIASPMRGIYRYIKQSEEKKQIGEEIASLEGRINVLNGKIEEEKKARDAEADQKSAPAKAKKDELQSKLNPVIKRISTINAILTKDPEE